MFWGPLLQVQVLKVGVPDMGFKPFPPLGEALWVVSFPPIMGCCTGDRVYGEPLCPISVWVFLVHPTCRSHSVTFYISFRGIVRYVAVCHINSVCHRRRWVQEPPTSPSWTRNSWPGTSESFPILDICFHFRKLTVRIVFACKFAKYAGFLYGCLFFPQVVRGKDWNRT